MSVDVSPSVEPCLTVGALRKILEGIDDASTVWVGVYDTGLEQWGEERCVRVAISYGAYGAQSVTIEGVR